MHLGHPVRLQLRFYWRCWHLICWAMGFGMRLILEPKTEEANLNAASKIYLEELLSSSEYFIF
jgi:hypothetical protein